MTAAIVDIKTQADVDRLFAGVAESFRRTRWEEWLTRELRGLEQEHARFFQSQSNPVGEKWAPLAPSTIKRKGHATILVDSTRLRQSLTQQNSEFGLRQVFDEEKLAGLVFGTDAPYSTFHDTGTERMPARKHVGVAERYFESMAVRAVDHAFEGLK